MCSHAEKNYEDVTQHDRTYLVGLCSGLFAASAIASTPSLSSLVPIAVQAVLMAFRLGLHVAALSDRLSLPTDRSESWTHVVPGLGEKEARAVLEDFNNSNVSSPAVVCLRLSLAHSCQRLYHRLLRPMSRQCLLATSPSRSRHPHSSFSQPVTSWRGHCQSPSMVPIMRPTSTRRLTSPRSCD